MYKRITSSNVSGTQLEFDFFLPYRRRTDPVFLSIEPVLNTQITTWLDWFHFTEWCALRAH